MAVYPNPGMSSNQGDTSWAIAPWQAYNNTPQVPVRGPQASSMSPQGMGQGVYPANGQTGFIVRPVASYDEAKAIPTDFMGNILIMPDFSHGWVYTKIFNPNTGGSILNVYRQVTIPEQGVTPPEQVADVPAAPVYDAKAEIDQLRAELDNIKHELGIEKEVTA